MLRSRRNKLTTGKLFVVFALVVLMLPAGCTSVTAPLVDESQALHLVRNNAAPPRRVDGDGWTLMVLPARTSRLEVVRRDGDEWASRRGDSLPDLVIATNPWRRSSGRQPVGLVRENGVDIASADGRYWAIAWSAGRLDLASQRETAGSNEHGNALGGFFPLLLDGELVAHRFPRGAPRAARVAFGWNADQSRLYVLASDGDRPFLARGLTTVEAARILHDAGAAWALNLDGGRSAYVRIDGASPGGVAGAADATSANRIEILPRVGFPRSVGPVGIGVWYNGAE